MDRQFKRLGMVHFRSKKLFKLRYVNLPWYAVIRLDLFTHSWYFIYRKDALQDLLYEEGYGYL